MAHPANLAADLIQRPSDAVTLVYCQPPLIFPMHATDPLMHADELAVDAHRFAAVDASVSDPATDPILQKLNALIKTLGCAGPESVRVVGAWGT